MVAIAEASIRCNSRGDANGADETARTDKVIVVTIIVYVGKLGQITLSPQVSKSVRRESLSSEHGPERGSSQATRSKLVFFFSLFF